MPTLSSIADDRHIKGTPASNPSTPHLIVANDVEFRRFQRFFAVAKPSAP